MDKITISLLEEFSKATGLSPLAEDVRFEHFATFLAVSRHFAETFDTTDVVVGSGGDTGLDGVAIIVNGALVTDVDQVADLVDTNAFLDATFIFVQAERSAKFDGAKIGTFGYGAVDFFSNTPKLDRNKQIKACVEIMEAIYEKSSMFKRGNPICRLYYVTSGKWTGDVNLEGQKTGERRLAVSWMGAQNARSLRKQ